ncbi:hypothetical protein [Paenibacillus alvei]|uniref:Uncharacterized protein n=1 Tax=Paenibacillus alvei TaxID=44250 RepID=A0A383RIU9_PAEAL|nr:conserved protein of unknown function [Paenibacillus alvei]
MNKWLKISLYFLGGIVLLVCAGKKIPLVFKTLGLSSVSASVVAENSLHLRMEQSYQARL